MAQDHIIFVYGTLKQGFYNHAIMEKIGFSYLGTGVTRNAYALVVGGKYNVPFLFEPKDTPGNGGEAHQIAGEVYRISSALLDELDVLEGVAHGYYVRRKIAVAVTAAEREASPPAGGLRRRRRARGGSRSPRGASPAPCVVQECWCWLKQDPSPALLAAPRHAEYTAALHALYVTPPERVAGDADTGYVQPPAARGQAANEKRGGWLMVTGTLAGFWVLLVCFWFWWLALPGEDPTATSD